VLEVKGPYESLLVLSFGNTNQAIDGLVASADVVGVQEKLRARFEVSLLRKIDSLLSSERSVIIVMTAPPFSSAYLFKRKKPEQVGHSEV
jgi:hypothetical protein